MRNIICFITLFCIMIPTSLMQGCGNGEDETGKAVSGPSDTQTIVEQESARSAIEAGETGPQKTSPEDPVEMRPPADEIMEDISAEKNEVASRVSKQVAALTETVPAAKDIIDVITIENQNYTSDKKGPVIFSHLKHNEEYGASCVECHHVYKDGKNQWKEGGDVDKCIICHDPVDEKEGVIKLQNAFHKNCKDCHSEANKEGKEAPSTKCNECHG